MSYYEQADKQIVKAIQGVTDARVDGYFGEQSLFNLFLKLCNFDDYSPIATNLFGGHLIMANKDQVHFAETRNKYSTKDFSKWKRITLPCTMFFQLIVFCALLQ